MPTQELPDSANVTRGIPVDSLRPAAREALKSATAIRQYLPSVTPLQRASVFFQLIDMMEMPVRGVAEIPQHLVAEKLESPKLPINKDGSVFIEKSTIKSVQKDVNKALVIQTTGGEYRISVSPTPNKNELTMTITTSSGGTDIFYNINNIANNSDPNVTTFLTELSRYLMDGMIVVSSVKKKDTDIWWTTSPSEENQQTYAAKLQREFKKLEQSVTPGQAVASKVETAFQPKEGFLPPVGAALSSIDAQLKSMGHPELMEPFIAFIKAHHLEGQIDTLWTDLRTGKLKGSLYEHFTYGTYGEDVLTAMRNAWYGDKGKSTFNELLPEERVEFHKWQDNALPVFSALRGVIKTINLVDHLEGSMGINFQRLNGIAGSDFDGLAKLVTGSTDPILLEGKKGALQLQMCKVGPYLQNSSDYKNLAAKLGE